ncbi:MAG: MinD/ParA family protein [Deltaproteobacteria bacterium]|nr:MinD/ParA family protein [Deltaproteobacteria bacterium]
MASPKIISVAGGKGGIGKSIIAANVAVTMANRGYRVVAVDLDLGASNLHAFLGVKNSGRNILNFAERSDVELDSMVLPTRFKGAGLICGAANVAGAANIGVQEKARIIDNLSTLTADYVILDLGAGSSFNVTDFFLVGNQGIIVIVPEITSLLDAYSFLKSTLHRHLQLEWKSVPEVASIILEFKNPNNPRRIVTVEQLIKAVQHVSLNEAQRMRRLIQSFEVKVVLNKVRNQKDFQVVKTIKELSHKNLSLAVHDAGYIPYDTEVSRSVNQMTPFVHLAPRRPATRQIDKLCREIVQA